MRKLKSISNFKKENKVQELKKSQLENIDGGMGAPVQTYDDIDIETGYAGNPDLLCTWDGDVYGGWGSL